MGPGVQGGSTLDAPPSDLVPRRGLLFRQHQRAALVLGLLHKGQVLFAWFAGEGLVLLGFMLGFAWTPLRVVNIATVGVKTARSPLLPRACGAGARPPEARDAAAAGPRLVVGGELLPRRAQPLQDALQVRHNLLRVCLCVDVGAFGGVGVLVGVGRRAGRGGWDRGDARAPSEGTDSEPPRPTPAPLPQRGPTRVQAGGGLLQPPVQVRNRLLEGRQLVRLGVRNPLLALGKGSH